MTWIIGLIALAIGGALGVIFSKATQKDYDEQKVKIDDLEQQLGQVQQTSDSFQDQVSEHFVKTSDLFEEMTQKYRDIYEQLAADAQSLCQPGTNATLLTSTLEVQTRSTENIEDIQEDVKSLSAPSEEETVAEIKSAADTETVQSEAVAETKEIEDITTVSEEAAKASPTTATKEAVSDDKKSDVVDNKGIEKDEDVTVIAATKQDKDDSARASVH